MFEKNLHISYLLDFYGDILNEKTHRIMDQYYNDDLSLAEIAEIEEMSRQGVRSFIKKGEEELQYFENQLGYASKHEEMQKAADSLESYLKDDSKLDLSLKELIESTIQMIRNF